MDFPDSANLMRFPNRAASDRTREGLGRWRYEFVECGSREAGPRTSCARLWRSNPFRLVEALSLHENQKRCCHGFVKCFDPCVADLPPIDVTQFALVLGVFALS
jgi:hypothetical protein